MRVFDATLPLRTVACILAIAFATAFSIAPSAAYADCAVRSNEAYIPQPPPGASVAAAYFTLINDCQSAAVVIGVEAGSTDKNKSTKSGAGAISLHQSSIVDGIARMMQVKRIPLQAGSSVAFAPGGLHVMVHGQELRAGETFQFHLVLEDGDRVSVLADVVASSPSAHRDHEHHGEHGDHKNHPAGDVE